MNSTFKIPISPVRIDTKFCIYQVSVICYKPVHSIGIAHFFKEIYTKLSPNSSPENLKTQKLFNFGLLHSFFKIKN
jgi:hypothetical protein